MSDGKSTLYERLGGYDAITAVASDLLPRLQTDPQLGRFWAHRADDSIQREKQLLIDYLCACAGGPCTTVAGTWLSLIAACASTRATGTYSLDTQRRPWRSSRYPRPNRRSWSSSFKV